MTPGPSRLHRLGSGVAVCLLPVVAGLYVATSTFGGRPLPWRANMVDLEVYRRAGLLLLHGGDIYDVPGQLPFLYPPFAALLAVPLALLPATLVEVSWTVAGVLSILAILHRFGLRGWVLSLLGTAVVLLVEPVSETLAFGQLGIFLVALVLLDLAPGPRVLGSRRLLPEGVLTALATAVKLTPGIFLLYLVATRKARAALAMAVAGLAVTGASALVAPSVSRIFWGRLAHGDTGLGHSIIYYTNQSVMADVVRIFGLGSGVAAAGLAVSAVVGALGVWVAARWHQLGEVRLAVSLCGIAGLLASPVSWLHHFVWVVPLGLCLLEGTLIRRADVAGVAGAADDHFLLPAWFRILGWLFVGWLIAAPFLRLPNGADVELRWTWQQNLLACVTAIVGLALLLAGLLVAGAARRASSAVD